MLAQKAREVLEVLQREGLLDRLILIGSWCAHFYETYFRKGSFEAGIKTLDMDFLVPKTRALGDEAKSIEKLLKPLDFEADFTASGWERFVHPDLRVEFLIPRIGAMSDNPRTIKELGVVAMPLRHTSALISNVVIIERDGLRVKVPHPVAFSLHKLFVSTRRKEMGKGMRDRELSFRILTALPHAMSKDEVLKIWESFTAKEKKAIVEVIAAEGREELLQKLGIETE